MREMTHPEPQFQRDNVILLDGKWNFTAFEEDGSVKFSGFVTVPFCPESQRSGVGYTGFIKSCEYRRTVSLSALKAGRRLMLHFGAVDYEARVYVNGKFVGSHCGGYTPFAFNIAPFVKVGDNEIVVKVYDDVTANLPSGKQSARPASYGCFYSRITGIWQSVWLYETPAVYLRSVRFYPHPSDGTVDIELDGSDTALAEISVAYANKSVGKAHGNVRGRARFTVALDEIHLWELGHGRLYDVTIKFGDDIVKSYFGLRDVRYEGRKFLLNGKCVFQRLVLNQGYNPDGLYTSADDDAMVRDVEAALRFGFNGARLHQSVFEPRFLYHCDRLGFMVWGEYPSWGVRYSNIEALPAVAGEWAAVIERDFNHPSIVTWCPLNEAWEDDPDDQTKMVRDVRFVDAVYALTKSLDPTRPCVDVSGGYHGHRTDVYDFHCYHGPEQMQTYLAELSEHDRLPIWHLYAPEWANEDLPYEPGMPTHASEYGGMAFASACENGWGYADMRSEEQFVNTYVALTERLLGCEKLSGFCYTQLYDVEQEKNGLLYYDRSSKLSPAAEQRIAACNSAPAAIELQDAAPEAAPRKKTKIA